MHSKFQDIGKKETVQAVYRFKIQMNYKLQTGSIPMSLMLNMSFVTSVGVLGRWSAHAQAQPLEYIFTKLLNFDTAFIKN